VLDEEVDPLGDAEFFQQGLTESGVLHELLGDRIAHHSGIRGAVEELLHLRDEIIGKSKQDGLHQFPETPGFVRGRPLFQSQGGDRGDAGKGIWFPREPLREADAAQAVQEEIGTTVGLLPGGSDKARCSDLGSAGCDIRDLRAG